MGGEIICGKQIARAICVANLRSRVQTSVGSLVWWWWWSATHMLWGSLCSRDSSWVCFENRRKREGVLWEEKTIYISLTTVMRTSWTFVLPLGAGAIVAAISFSGLLSLQSLYFLGEFKGYIKSTKSTQSKCWVIAENSMLGKSLYTDG
jgi:hypothetical protein